METPLKRARLGDPRKPSQREVAEAVGINQGFYSRVENAECSVSASVAERLAQYFGGAVTEMAILYPERDGVAA